MPFSVASRSGWCHLPIIGNWSCDYKGFSFLAAIFPSLITLARLSWTLPASKLLPLVLVGWRFLPQQVRVGCRMLSSARLSIFCWELLVGPLKKEPFLLPFSKYQFRPGFFWNFMLLILMLKSKAPPSWSLRPLTSSSNFFVYTLVFSHRIMF